MGERASYEAGTFSWTDLATSDPDGAKAFYGELFGWSFEDMPTGEGSPPYSMAILGGHSVCALYGSDQGPPAWLSYVTVQSADSAAARAAELGGSLVQEPFDVFDAGRMAVAADPAGAVFAVWEARRSPGATLVNGPGVLSLNQLNTNDTDGAVRFYSELFGWRIEEIQGGPQRYWGIHRGESMNGGMMELPRGAGVPPHWLTYFGTEDADEAARRIDTLGGSVAVPPTDVPGGRFLLASDPQGAVFALFAGRFDP